MSRRIVLISCVKTKRARPCAAKELYISTLFNAQREFAEATSACWFILSAKYGLLHPDTKIEPYEMTLNGASSLEKKDWSNRVYSALTKELRPSDQIVITAGENYCKYLVPLIAAGGHSVIRPLKGLRMGFQPGRLRALIENPRPLTP